jgi:hypothetical protein
VAVGPEIEVELLYIGYGAVDEGSDVPEETVPIFEAVEGELPVENGPDEVELPYVGYGAVEDGMLVPDEGDPVPRVPMADEVVTNEDAPVPDG